MADEFTPYTPRKVLADMLRNLHGRSPNSHAVEVHWVRSLAHHFGIDVPELTPVYVDGLSRMLELIEAAERVERG